MQKVSDIKYIEAIGRRKTAIARVRIVPEAKTSYEINGKTIELYFPTKELQSTIMEPIAESKLTETKFNITILTRGGGKNSQADAIKLGISRALIKYDKELRGRLKKVGLLKRDPRAKERRKFGLKKARKSPQWSKR